jgi:hypothetical protein
VNESDEPKLTVWERLDPIAAANATPLALITGDQLAACRCGRDEYSALPLEFLRLLVDNTAAMAATDCPAAEAVALRWQLRGLTPERAALRAQYEFATGRSVVDRKRAIAAFLESRN